MLQSRPCRHVYSYYVYSVSWSLTVPPTSNCFQENNSIHSFNNRLVLLSNYGWLHQKYFMYTLTLCIQSQDRVKASLIYPVVLLSSVLLTVRAIQIWSIWRSYFKLTSLSLIRISLECLRCSKPSVLLLFILFFVVSLRLTSHQGSSLVSCSVHNLFGFICWYNHTKMESINQVLL